jgi:hypothetical protein
MPAVRSCLGIRSRAITYTDSAQVNFTYFFTLYSMTSMWVARPERFELPTSWFVGSRSITRKPMILSLSRYSTRLIFMQDMSPQVLVCAWPSPLVLDVTSIR